MENYDSNIFQLDFNSSEESFYTSSGMVEQVKQIEINLNEDRNLYFNVYKTNIDRFDSIKMNLDTLLVQTECIIIMWDNSSPKTFENIPPLISTIEDSLKQSEFKVPIFVLQNKMDLKFDLDEISVAKEKFDESIKKLKDNPNITYKEITLKDNQKKDFYELIGEIDSKLSEISPKKINDIFKVKYHHPLKQKINKNVTNIINCLLLGNQGSGKTSFIKSLLGEIITNLLSTIGLEKTPFNFSVEGKDCTFTIQDTAGQERFNSLAHSYYRNADAFLLFFDVTNKESFDTIQRWIKSIVESKGNINDQYELFLVANKIDETDIRKIGKTQGKELATKYNIKYFEISCLKKINLYELLYEITLMSYKKCKLNERRKSIKLNKKKIKKQKCC
jgi:small GTP-binding protein